MSFKPYTEKIKQKKIGICSILGRIRIQNRTRIQIHHPESGFADPDPRQNNTYRSKTLYSREGRVADLVIVGLWSNGCGVISGGLFTMEANN